MERAIEDEQDARCKHAIAVDEVERFEGDVFLLITENAELRSRVELLERRLRRAGRPSERLAGEAGLEPAAYGFGDRRSST